MRSSKKKKTKKAKLNLGDYLKQNSSGIAAAGNMTGSLIRGVSPSSDPIAGGLSGLISGGSAGAALGVPGIIGGALIGGVTGVLGANEDKKIATQANRDRMRAEDEFLIGNRNYKHGGKMLSKKLNVLDGGHLEAISDDAVEVKADSNETDSVELQDAYVDNNEIIDTKDRVFSDSVYLPDGKSIAKVAKSLEKQKAEDYETRFKASNQRIDQKLDELFNYQESMKSREIAAEESMPAYKKGGKKQKRRPNSNNFTNTEPNPDFPGQIAVLAKGGKIHIKPENKGKFNALKKRTGKSTEELTHSKNSLTRKRAVFAQNAKKWKHALGGELGEPPLRSLYKKGDYPLNSQAEHDNFYTRRAMTMLTPEDNQSLGTMQSDNSPEALQAFLASKFEFPQYNASKNKLLPDLKYQYQADAFTGTEQPGKGMMAKKGKFKGGVLMTEAAPAALVWTPPRRFTKAKLGKGGKKPAYQFGIGEDPYENSVPLGGSDGSFTTSPEKASKLSGQDFQKFGTTLATFGPNLVSAYLQKKLAPPAAPQMETATTLDRVNSQAQLAAIDSDAATTNALLTRNTAQASNLTSGLGANLARKLRAKNEVYGQDKRINAGIQSNEAFVRAQQRARNAERISNFGNLQTEFKNKKLQMTSENVANLSTKVLQLGRERNLMSLDRDRYNIIKQQYNDLPGEMRAKYPNLFDAVNAGVIKVPDGDMNKRFGGRIKRTIKRK